MHNSFTVKLLQEYHKTWRVTGARDSIEVQMQLPRHPTIINKLKGHTWLFLTYWTKEKSPRLIVSNTKIWLLLGWLCINANMNPLSTGINEGYRWVNSINLRWFSKFQKWIHRNYQLVLMIALLYDLLIRLITYQWFCLVLTLNGVWTLVYIKIWSDS